MVAALHFARAKNNLHLEELESPVAKVKYARAKVLLNLAKENPNLLYEDYDQWVHMLDWKNSIMKWTAIDIIGYLSSVDHNGKTKKQLGRLFSFLQQGQLITANHAVFALGLIAGNRSEFRGKIIRELLKTEDYQYETTECKAIVTGKVIEALKPFASELADHPAVLQYLHNALKSQRNATRKKAEAFLKKMKVK